MSLVMTKEEREAFHADVHIGIIGIAEEGRGPLMVPTGCCSDSARSSR